MKTQRYGISGWQAFAVIAVCVTVMAVVVSFAPP